MRDSRRVYKRKFAFYERVHKQGEDWPAIRALLLDAFEDRSWKERDAALRSYLRWERQFTATTEYVNEETRYSLHMDFNHVRYFLALAEGLEKSMLLPQRKRFDRKSDSIFRGLLGVVLVAAAASGSPASAEPAEWEERPHHLSIIVAGTDDDEETAFTLGVDYEYRLHDLLGVGVVAEYAFEDIDAVTLLAVADLHIWSGFAIQTGPGVEFIDGDGEESDEEEFVYRFGALYEFEIDRLTLSPQVHYDISTGKDAVIFGVALGFGF